MSDAPRSFWKELKQRKVVRVVGVYAAVAWAIVLGASELRQILELPAWVPQVVLVLAGLGLPAAMVLAWAFEVTPEGVRRTLPRDGATVGPSSRKPFVLGAVAGVATLSLVAFLARGSVKPGPEREGPELDEALVAIVPFRYSGPPELDYLGDGVFQLLAARFTGEVGPRATDPSATATLWDRAVEADPTTAGEYVAMRLGAALVLSGGVVAGPDGLNISAALRDVRDGSEVAVASAQGSPDSLAVVVGRLAGGLLSLSVGEYEGSLQQLTSADPEALRAYLLGQVEFRRGRVGGAFRRFAEAVQIDSTFALAAIWLADTELNTSPSPTGAGLQLAWRHKDRLSERDRLYLSARLGPNYPDPSLRRERKRALQEALRLAPERSSAWYFLGDLALHFPDSAQAIAEARLYFERALELDPRDGNALGHAVAADMLMGEPSAIVASLDRLAAVDTTASRRAEARLVRALTQGDSLAARTIFDSIQATFPLAVPVSTQSAPILWISGWQAEVSLAALRRRREALVPGVDSEGAYHLLYYAFQDLGRPREADEALAALERAVGVRRSRMRVLDAMYGTLPPAVGEADAQSLDEGLPDPSSAAWTFSQAADAAALQMWRIQRGQLAGVAEAVRAIRRSEAGRPEASAKAFELLAVGLEASAAAQTGAPSAATSIAAVDSLMLEGPPGFFPLDVNVYDALVLAAAEVYERLGAHAKALRMLERGSNNQNLHNAFKARFARERGRLAALTGDIARARREYQLLLWLRAAADPSLDAEVVEVRAALAALGGS